MTAFIMEDNFLKRYCSMKRLLLLLREATFPVHLFYLPTLSDVTACRKAWKPGDKFVF